MNDSHRIIFDGASDECYRRIGFARRVMFVLENMMKQRRLDQHVVRVLTGDGALVTCSKVFGTKTTTISVGEQYLPPLPVEYRCLCGCNYTEGWIFEVKPDPLEGDGSTLYKVMACHNEVRYVLVDNVLASDFTPYEIGWPVLLIPYNNMSYLCCTEPTGATGCRSVESAELIESEDWRTTFRIIPWCAIRVPKWRRK